MLNSILNSGLTFSIEDGRLSAEGPASLRKAFRDSIRRNKPELLKILAGETIHDVGSCDHCAAELLGLPVHGGYINRVCPDCGQWFRCLPPIDAKPVIPKTTTDLVCNSQPIPLF